MTVAAAVSAVDNRYLVCNCHTGTQDVQPATAETTRIWQTIDGYQQLVSQPKNLRWRTQYTQV